MTPIATFLRWSLFRWDRTTGWSVLAALVGLIPRIVVATRQFIEYDGWWHIFAAEQEVWSNFVWEFQATTHPPLYFLLLKVAMLFGSSRLVYRLVSLIAGFLIIVVVAKTAQRVTKNPAVPPLVALGFSLSWGAIVISCEVRSYALCMLFVALATYALFALMEPRLREVGRDARRCCVFVSLALFSHFGAALFLVATIVVITVRLALNRRFRQRVTVVLKKKSWQLLPPAMIPAATGLFLYLTQLKSRIVPLNHLSEFYLSSSTAAGPADFLVRNTALQVSLFLPVKLVLSGLTGQIVIVLASLVVVIVLVAATRSVGGGTGRRTVGAMFVALVVVAMALGLMGAYPYGGALRHQFYLFPFALLLVAVGLDWVLDWVRRPSMRAIIVVAVGCALATSFVAGARSFFWHSEEFAGAEVSRFRETFRPSAAVYLDQFSLIPFFAFHHDWTWRWSGVCPTNWSIQRYVLTRNGQELTVYRDQARWEIKLDTPQAAIDLHGCLEDAATHSLVVFALHQFPQQDASIDPNSEEVWSRTARTLAGQNIVLKKVTATPSSTFVQLALAQYSP